MKKTKKIKGSDKYRELTEAQQAEVLTVSIKAGLDAIPMADLKPTIAKILKEKIHNVTYDSILEENALERYEYGTVHDVSNYVSGRAFATLYKICEENGIDPKK